MLNKIYRVYVTQRQQREKTPCDETSLIGFYMYKNTNESDNNNSQSYCIETHYTFNHSFLKECIEKDINGLMINNYKAIQTIVLDYAVLSHYVKEKLSLKEEDNSVLTSAVLQPSSRLISTIKVDVYFKQKEKFWFACVLSFDADTHRVLNVDTSGQEASFSVDALRTIFSEKSYYFYSADTHELIIDYDELSEVHQSELKLICLLSESDKVSEFSKNPSVQKSKTPTLKNTALLDYFVDEIARKVTNQVHLNNELKFALKFFFFINLILAVAFIVFSALAFAGVIAAPFSFMTVTTATIPWLIGSITIAVAAVPVMTLIIGSIYGVLSFFLKEGYAEIKVLYERVGLVRDTTNLGTLLGFVAAGLFIAGFVLVTLGLSPAVAGITLVTALTSVFGSSLVAGITATVLFSVIAVIAGRAGGCIIGLFPLLFPLGRITIPKTEVRVFILYQTVRSWLVPTWPSYDGYCLDEEAIEPTEAKHPIAGSVGFFIGAALGTTALVLSILFAPEVVAMSFTFWGPFLIGAAMVLGGGLVSAIVLAGMMEWRDRHVSDSDEETVQSSNCFSSMCALFTCGNTNSYQKVSEHDPSASYSTMIAKVLRPLACLLPCTWGSNEVKGNNALSIDPAAEDAAPVVEI